MEITMTELYLFTWAFIASIGTLYYQNLAFKHKSERNKAVHIAVMISKDERLRKDFVTEFADPYIKARS